MRLLTVILLAFVLSACASSFKNSVLGGGYYQDDGPLGTNKNLDAIPDATPKIEPLHKGTMKPYTVLGKSYTPNTTLKAYKERGIASWYGKKFHGKKTSIGEPYDMFAMTAAHKTLALPSYVRVTRVATGKSVIVRLTDRGPFHEGRIIDLSYTAAYKLGILEKGSDTVIVEAIIPSPLGVYTTTASQTSKKETLKNVLRSNISMAQILSTRRGVAASDIAPIQTAFNTNVVETAKNIAGAPLEKIAQMAQTDDPIAQFLKTQTENIVSESTDKDFDALEAIAIAANAIAVDSPASLEKTSVSALSYFVQLGSFSSSENAELAREKMTAQLPWLNVLPAVFSNGNLHRVQIGPFLSKDEALQLIERIEKTTNLQPALATQY